LAKRGRQPEGSTSRSSSSCEAYSSSPESSLFLLQSFPETFSVPKRFAKHMMIVADLEQGNPDVIEDAVIGAWELQSGK
jgi:hypothetical protein